MKILKENMRRFRTKNLSEQSPTPPSEPSPAPTPPSEPSPAPTPPSVPEQDPEVNRKMLISFQKKLIDLYKKNPDLADSFIKDKDPKKVDFMNSLLYVVRGKGPETDLTAHISKNTDIVKKFVYHMRGR